MLVLISQKNPMRQLLITALLCFSSFDIFPQSGWVWQNPVPQGNYLNDIKMFISGTGYCKSEYNILKTTNFGNNWFIILNSEYVIDIDFINELTGYHIKGNYDNHNQLFKTVNGGATWNFINIFSDIISAKMYWLDERTGYTLKYSLANGDRILEKTTNGGVDWGSAFFDPTISINSISFPSVLTGYIIGKTKNISSHPAKFLKTTNSGHNWDSVTIKTIGEIKSVFFLNTSTGYISGQGINLQSKNLFRTTTGGLSWDSLYKGAYFSKLQFSDFNTGYGLTGVTEMLQKTTNAGINWTSIEPPPELEIYSGDFSTYNTDNIITCGYGGTLGKSTNSGLNWVSCSQGFHGSLSGLTFFDAYTGIATGDKYRLGGVVLRTTNSGQQWYIAATDSSILNAVTTCNQNTAYIAEYGKILKTTNKGESFETRYTNIRTDWKYISFPSENTGYVVGEYGQIAKTTDGGQSWNNLNQYGASNICFSSNDTGFVMGVSGLIKTTNGGQSWGKISTGYERHITTNIKFIKGNLFLLGFFFYQQTTTGAFLKSTDLGLSWKADSVSDEIISDISLPAQNIIYLMGRNKVFKSTNDSGWTATNLFALGDHNSIFFINRDTGFAATTYGGILKTTTGGETIIVPPPEIPAEYSLLQSYPNPFNTSCIIGYALPENTFVKIKIYDILGRLVTQLVNSDQEAGKYSVTFNASNFASGVYFYQIETPEFTQSKKMVLVK